MNKTNIISAMRISGVKILPEGYLYSMLFKHGLGPEDATRVVIDLLDTGEVERINCVLVLRDGKKDSTRSRAVCNR